MLNRQLSIKHYALSFILLYIFIFLVSSAIAFWDIQAVNQKIAQSHLKDGRDELIDAINKVVQNHKNLTDKFAAWDEVHQQVGHPDYYSYWQTHRMFSSAILPDHFTDAAIYNSNGIVLAHLSTSSMPDTITPDNIESYFNIENNIPYLVTISRIFDRDMKEKTLGFAVTKSQVMSPLLVIKQFNFIDSQSIKINRLEKRLIKTNHFINYLSFDIKQNHEMKLFAEQLEQAVIRNTLILIAFALFFYFLMSFFLSRPLRKISVYIDTLNNNPEFQYIPELKLQFQISELEKVRDSLTQYQNKLQTVYINLDDKNKELWQLAHHDALTGALNRRAFEEQWQKISEFFAESRGHVSLILFDINHFKSINDSYGHPVGDEVLKKIALAIEQTLRKGEKLYRIGGDEFATILHNCNPEDALFAANRCRKAISEISFLELGIKEPIRASMGIAHNDTNDLNSIADLLWQADVAVYYAKKPGQSHIITYSDEIKNVSGSVLSSEINSIVFHAIENGTGITMFYQPIINLEAEHTEYYEALLRINKEDKKFPPEEVFQLIEARKLENEMDTAIFKHIAKDFKQGLIPKKSGVSINVSGPSIINPQIIDQLSLFVPFLSHYKIVLEITETSLITQIAQAAEHINALKKMGFLIALDDFGSGYSSIGYLSSMPVDIVKFDISLIRQLDDEKQYSMIRHLTAMIKETGHLLVAEGIETEASKEKIKQLGFNYAQGYLFGKPSPDL